MGAGRMRLNPWSYVIHHGSEVEFAGGAATIRHPLYPTIRLIPKAAARFILSPINTAGQRLELRA
jgi:hypothetical protein